MDVNLLPKEAYEIAKEVYGDVAKHSTIVVGEAIAGTLKLVTLPFRCLGISADALEEKYKNFIADTARKVPIENIQSPSPAIAGPTFEHIKYRFDEPDVVKLFSNLLAGAMDKEKSDTVHPSFAYILQQMNTYEARIFNIIAVRSFKQKKVISRIILTKHIIKDLVTVDWKVFMNSLSNLIRLGIIEIVEIDNQEPLADYEYLSINAQVKEIGGICGMCPTFEYGKKAWDMKKEVGLSPIFQRILSAKGFVLTVSGVEMAYACVRKS